MENKTSEKSVNKGGKLRDDIGRKKKVYIVSLSGERQVKEQGGRKGQRGGREMGGREMGGREKGKHLGR